MDNSFLHTKRLLLVDDEQELLKMVSDILKDAGFETVLTAMTVKEAILTAKEETPDLIVLDVMLPGMDGFQVIQKIREMSAVPVLMLTAKTASADKVNGLRSGADDYLTKPFDVEEFIARVLSLIRRYTTLNNGSSEEPNRLSFQNLTIDLNTRIVDIGDGQVELHAKEFDILCYLARNQGRILTKQQIYEEVWQETYAYDDNNIMGYISKLRKQIEADPNNPTYIQTVKGVGYRFSQEV